METEPNLLYFICCGPGDPDLITVRGLRALADCRFVLASTDYAKSFARYLIGREVQSPFVLDRASLIAWVEERLVKGPVALLVPGDFSVYCPFQSFVADFEGRCEVIPGISSHVAAFALLKKSMDAPQVAHTGIITSPKAYSRDSDPARFRSIAGPGKTLILYMIDRQIGTLAADLMEAYPPTTPIAVFEALGAPEQKVTVSTLEKVEADFSGRDPFGIGSNDPEPTLALVVVGETVVTDESPEWWNHRYEKIWKPRGMS